VQSRNISNARMYSVDWRPKTALRDGLAITYEWVKQQVKRHVDMTMTATSSASAARNISSA